ncbi:hypothetical protein I7I51_01421 [Histoplasma capsulatum]|uniref:Uncharacterized protein n=1 Tax=Ajellomyces capsulatus TaxID=5037 RepID=A0A8A1MIC3_AJECA|nr:hypothetical protein I7I51_01421 [Histoplasma capsulatum]
MSIRSDTLRYGHSFPGFGTTPEYQPLFVNPGFERRASQLRRVLHSGSCHHSRQEPSQAFDPALILLEPIIDEEISGVACIASI